MSSIASAPLQLVDARVERTRALVPGKYFLTTLHAPPIAARVMPGQFVMVDCASSDSLELAVPRAFSVCDVEGENILLFYKLWGRGTEYLSQRPRGSRVRVFGPLGRGFDLRPEERLLVAGGTGVAPLVFLSRHLEGRTEVILAGRSAEDLHFVSFFEARASRVHLCTEDGSRGVRGYPTPLVEQILSRRPLRLVFCGPPGMVRALWELGLSYGARMEVALEAPMACGVGACLGCVDAYFGIHVCFEGPVWRNFS